MPTFYGGHNQKKFMQKGSNIVKPSYIEFTDEEVEHMEEEKMRVVQKRYGKCIATIRSPILTPEEYEKRLNVLKQATVNFVLAAEESKRKHELEEAERNKEKKE